MLSIVTPAYNEAPNLPLLHARLSAALSGLEWQWVVVDDHSSDGTFAAAAALARDDPRVRAFRLARNSGSHAAIACGLDHAGGDAGIVMAADLQDPPEILPELIERWRHGAQVVWAARATAPASSRTYYSVMRRMAGMDRMPPAGADFFLIDRVVIEAFRRFSEQHTSIFALIAWMGFRQATVTYSKQARVHGRSGWTLRKKADLLADSIAAFTYAPIRLMTYAGATTALAGFLYAGYLTIRTAPAPGWTLTLVAILVLGGVQLLAMGVLGEYLWRALAETRRRPRYLIEDSTE